MKNGQPAPSADQTIIAIAARQHGVVTRLQLLQAGIAPDVVDRKSASGWLRRAHRGVYIAGPVEAPYARQTAAVLALGDNAALSHWSAAFEWKIVPRREDLSVDVIVAGRRPDPRPGVRLHLVQELHADEVTKLHGIRITTPARTLLDLAVRAEHRELERALAESFALRLTTPAKVAKLLRRYPARAGVKRLQILLAPGARPGITRSELEELFLALVRQAEIQDPELNVRIEGFEVDCLWRAERLIVEIDGRAFHSSDRAFESDRHRDARLVAAGWRVMRITWHQITNNRWQPWRGSYVRWAFIPEGARQTPHRAQG